MLQIIDGLRPAPRVGVLALLTAGVGACASPASTAVPTTVGGPVQPIATAPSTDETATPAAASARPQATEPPGPTLDSYPLRVQRLARLGQLWGAVRYLHPYPAYRNIDWDGAALSAIAQIDDARDGQAYGQAAAAMVAALGDPATVVVRAESPDARAREAQPAVPGDAAPRAGHRTLSRGGRAIAVVDLGTGDSMDVYRAMQAARPALTGASGVVFDLRHLSAEGVGWVSWLFTSVHDTLIAQATELPARRAVIHSGYRSQFRQGSGGYYTGFVNVPAEVVEPKATSPHRVVFLLGHRPVVPEIAVPLHASGLAAIVAEHKRIDDSAFIDTLDIDIGDGWVAKIRTTEATFRGANIELRADRVFDDTGTDERSPAFRAAVALAAAPTRTRAARATRAAPPATRWRRDPVYAELDTLSPAHRVLAAYRLWNVIHYFYPYLDLIGDWNRVLPLAITELEAAGDRAQYRRAVTKVAAHISDTHTFVFTGDGSLSRKTPPLTARIVEDKPVVIDAPEPARAAGAAVGDIIETIDGVPTAEALARLRPYVAGSTETARVNRVLADALAGTDATPLTLGLRGADGAVKQVTLQRDPKARPTAQNSDQPFRLIAPDLGYVDLRALSVQQVDPMFEALRTTDAIIFDMRGYPRGTAWTIAPRLVNRPGPINAAIFQRQLVTGLEAEDTHAQYRYVRKLPTSDKWKYTGKTYMLIDDRAISQAEYTGMFLAAANGTEFIGTHSSGANGDVTATCLPGPVCVGFTGQAVSHPDGRRLQRVGLIPHLRVAPTIAGIRAGKDEVLDAAIARARAAIQ